MKNTIRSASIAEVKARFSEFVARARRGEDVIITDRGQPVARLAPLPAETRGSARVQELIRTGLMTAPEKALPADFFEDMPADPEGELLKAVLAERKAGW